MLSQLHNNLVCKNVRLLAISFNSAIIEIYDDKLWIHETQSAINHEFKIRSIKASSLLILTCRRISLFNTPTNPKKMRPQFLRLAEPI